jgi:hypothetical protein
LIAFQTGRESVKIDNLINTLKTSIENTKVEKRGYMNE